MKKSKANPAPRGGRRQAIKPPKITRMNSGARRAQLLHCAVEASAEAGISRVVHADVARKALVSIATVFGYFPTRKDLVNAVLRDVRRFYLKLLNEASVEVSARQIVFTMFWKCVERARTEPQYVRVWLGWSTALRDDIWPQYLKVEASAIQLVQQVLITGQRRGEISDRLDTETAARVLIGGAHMAAMMVFSNAETPRLEAFVRHWIDAAIRP